MTRAPGELLRDVAKALACFASTKHAQAWVQKNPAIKAEMLEEVAYIEALEREVRDAAQAQAGQGEEVLYRRVVTRRIVQDVAPMTEEDQQRLPPDEWWLSTPPREAIQIRYVPVSAAQAQAGAGSEGQGEGA